MSLKLIILLRLVRLVNLPLALFVQFCVSRLFLLVEGVGYYFWRVRRFLLGNTIKIDGAYTRSHHVLTFLLDWMPWDDFVLCELGIGLKSVLLLKLLFLRLPSQLLLFVLH